MKEIKAYIHKNRLADVVHALKVASFKDISVIDVRGMMKALDADEREYSIDIGERVITEVKLELVCDDDRLDEAVETIRQNAQTGQISAGVIYVSEIALVVPIAKIEEKKDD
jgi:nitrogen regulatory protein P-II 1